MKKFLCLMCIFTIILCIFGACGNVADDSSDCSSLVNNDVSLSSSVITDASVDSDVTVRDIKKNTKRKDVVQSFVYNRNAFGYKFQNVPPSSKSNTSQLKAKLNQYLSNPFKYAPPIVDIVKGDKCHFIVVIGYGDNGKFLVLDPGYTKVYRKQKISYIGKIVQYYK